MISIFGFRLYKIPLHIAGFSALLTFPVFLLLNAIIVTSGNSWLLSSVHSLIVFAVVWYVSNNSLTNKFGKLSAVINALASKRFEEFKENPQSASDELENLTNEAIQALNSIELEFQRMFRLENYRKEFIGDISHELKTPIFAIQGFIETLLDGALEDEEVNRHFLEKAMKNVNRLTILTRDLMEISKLETGQLKSRLQPVNLSEVMLEVAESLYYSAQQENISLRIEEIQTDLVVMADKNQLRQVLINLIENAIKYNRPGGKVTVGLDHFRKGDAKVCVFVQDTGIGIANADIERVTERFFRADKSRSREKGGSGLGLSIVKHILEAHGEKLMVKSKPGDGSTFSFCLKCVS